MMLASTLSRVSILVLVSVYFHGFLEFADDAVMQLDEQDPARWEQPGLMQILADTLYRVL
jgi:predicted neuraminidase